MIVTQQGLLDFLSTEGASFRIPPYQRIYSWRESQCEELWLDVLRAGRAKRNHFLGTILYLREGTDPSQAQYVVIDGQQRMTSVSLMLLALSRHLDRHPSTGLSGEMLRARYLLSGPDDAEGPQPRLFPSHHDLAAYRLALKGAARPDEAVAEKANAIAKNLAFFASQMESDQFDAHTLMDGLNRLAIIAVEVEDASAAQSIFEGINSKGMPLSVADMVRNYLLLAESHDEQTRLYEEYWKSSQEMFAPDPGSLRLNTAIKSWISVRLKGARILSPDQVYSSFKRYVEDVYQGAKEPILRELRGFCLMWAENYRYHGVKKYKSDSRWAELGAPTLTAGYQLKKADNEAYAERVRKQLRETDASW